MFFPGKKPENIQKHCQENERRSLVGWWGSRLGVGATQVADAKCCCDKTLPLRLPSPAAALGFLLPPAAPLSCPDPQRGFGRREASLHFHLPGQWRETHGCERRPPTRERRVGESPPAGPSSGSGRCQCRRWLSVARRWLFLGHAPAQVSIEEPVDAAVEDFLEAAFRKAGAHVLDALIGMEKVVADL